MTNTEFIRNTNRYVHTAGNAVLSYLPCHQETIMPTTSLHAHTMSPDGTLREALDATDDINRILTLAREAGMLVTLDGQIGGEKYQSIAGSLNAFRRFARALCNGSTQAAAR